MRHYVTSADPGYLTRLKALVASMRRHCAQFRLHVLAVGSETVSWCAAQPDVDVIFADDFLARHPDLRIENLPGPTRNRMDEKLCTWRWRYVCDLIEQHGPMLAVDADVMFWSSAEPVFDEIGRAGAAVLPHAVPPAAAGLPGLALEVGRKYGLYNGGFVYFAELAPAARMAELVREWCYPGFREHPDGRQTYGDQGYLEMIQEEFGARVIRQPGAAPGPWNIHPYRISCRDDVVYFGGQPLVSFHYHSFRVDGHDADPTYAVHAHADGAAVAALYAAYRSALQGAA